jgi:hypothetical protein
MREIIGYISVYARAVNKVTLAACTLLTAILIYLNFHFDLDKKIDDTNNVSSYFYLRYLIFLVAFTLPYFFYLVFERKNYFNSSLFIFLLLVSPAIFSWKMAMPTEINLSDDIYWNYYWNQVSYWPLRLIMQVILLFIIWYFFFRKESFFGFTIKDFKWKPYLLMLLMMIPLIAAASTQADFLRMYPKLKDVNTVLTGVENKWFYHLLHEISYGSDFISVELFFRGFLVLAFIKIAGKDAILPMACYYCTIHFGKPLGECISSYFGGILLGIVVFNTRSIIGGLVVHLGIAWMMEIGGYLGNSFK